VNTTTTVQKLVTAIANHYLVAGEKRLLVEDVARQAGISRQAFNRYYAYLKPYVTGDKPVAELLNTLNSTSQDNLLAKSQQRIKELQIELQSSIKERQTYRANVEKCYLTTLMNDDITRFDSNEIRQLLEKQSAHNNLLLMQNRNLQLELAKSRAESIPGDFKANGVIRSAILLSPDFTSAFASFAKEWDKGHLEKQKDILINEMLEAAKKYVRKDGSTVVIFIDRYLSSFQSFAKTYAQQLVCSPILIRLPLFTRTEVRLFLKKIGYAVPIHVFYPVCDSSAIVNAQRSFIFRKVPECEFFDADNSYLPTITDGCDSVTTLKIKQGD